MACCLFPFRAIWREIEIGAIPMNLKLPAPEQQSKLLDVIAKSVDGLSIDELEAVGKLGLPRRTLQRRLNGLVAQGALRVQGQTRATRYHAVPGRRPLQSSNEGLSRSEEHTS